MTEEEVKAGILIKEEMHRRDIERAVERILTLGGGKARGMGLDDDIKSRDGSRVGSRAGRK